LNIVKKESSKTRIIVRMASQLITDNETEKAKTLVVDRINSVKSDNELYALYMSLSGIEKKLGNLKQSAYCLDKALYFSPMNKDVMFSSAFEAEKENIHYIEICNYNSLASIDDKNDTVLNNLAVSLNNQKLKSIATDFYIKSANLNNSLALTNLGFIYLYAGLTDKARELAEEAISKESPHPNAYALLTDINETIERENKQWEELKSNSLILQKESRFYTQAHYEKTTNNLKSIGTEWLVNGVEASIEINGNKIKIEWIDATTHPIKKISGLITKNSFAGRYSEKSETQNTSSLLGLNSNKNIDGMGYYNLDNQSIVFFSENINDIFKLKFTKK
ncbi:tetratricopeptide repeat protein, partial [Yersinia rochesterensis]